jgi:hypothetical protein
MTKKAARLRLINGSKPAEGNKPTKQKDFYAYRRNYPFARLQRRGEPVWSQVTPSGDYSQDYETGRDYALLFWKECGSRGSVGLDLAYILIGIHEAKRQPQYLSGKRMKHNLSGVEIGFLQTIGELMTAARNATFLVALGPGDQGYLRALGQKSLEEKMALAADMIGSMADGTKRPRKPTLTVVSSNQIA